MKSTVKNKEVTFFIRSLPNEVAAKIRKYAERNRMTLAGVVIRMSEKLEDDGFFSK